MTLDEKLEFIEKVLHAPEFSLEEETLLNTLDGWESLNILNLEMELIARGITVEQEKLMKCSTVGELCALID